MKKIYLFFVICVWIGCDTRTANETNNYHYLEGLAQGTTFHITYKDSLNRSFDNEIDSILTLIDQSLSIYIDTSVISLFNLADSVHDINEHLLNVFLRAREIHKETKGYFDPTIKPMTDYWGFGSYKENSQAVDSSHVDSLMQFIGMNQFKIVSGDQENTYTLSKSKKGAQLDFNGIAQGYTVDIIAEFLNSNEIYNYLVEIGGEVRVLGRNKQGKEWKIGIDKPVSDKQGTRELQALISFNNKSIATSGNYRKQKVRNGMKYSHTISAKTGYPIQHHILSATVVASDCITADAFATAFMAMGHEKAITYLEKEGCTIDGYLIYQDSDGKIVTYRSKGLKEKIRED